MTRFKCLVVAATVALVSSMCHLAESSPTQHVSIHLKVPRAQRDGGAPECTVAGITFNVSRLYLTGRSYLPGSYYAYCVDGKATCYMDDGIADRPERPEVPCDDGDLLAAVAAQGSESASSDE